MESTLRLLGLSPVEVSIWQSWSLPEPEGRQVIGESTPFVSIPRLWVYRWEIEPSEPETDYPPLLCSVWIPESHCLEAEENYDCFKLLNIGDNWLCRSVAWCGLQWERCMRCEGDTEMCVLLFSTLFHSILEIAIWPQAHCLPHYHHFCSHCTSGLGTDAGNTGCRPGTWDGTF